MIQLPMKALCVLCATAIMVTIAVCATYYLVRQAHIDAGYSQQTLPGTEGVYWVKNK